MDQLKSPLEGFVADTALPALNLTRKITEQITPDLPTTPTVPAHVAASAARAADSKVASTKTPFMGSPLSESQFLDVKSSEGQQQIERLEARAQELLRQRPNEEKEVADSETHKRLDKIIQNTKDGIKFSPAGLKNAG
jgi:hypothetical protein